MIYTNVPMMIIRKHKIITRDVFAKNINYVFVMPISMFIRIDPSIDRTIFFFFSRCSFWMKNFPMHFDLDKRLKETCERMKTLIESSADIECMKLVDVSQM